MRARTPQPLIAALLGLSLVLLLLGLALASLKSFERAAREADHTSRVKTCLSQTLGLVVDAETAQRGFLLTDRADYLQPYDRARQELPRTMDQARALLADSPSQLGRLEDLDRDTQSKLAELTETIDLEEGGAHDRALAIVKSDRGRATMDSVRGVVANMTATEDTLLAQRSASASRFARVGFLGIGVATVLLLAVGVALEALARRLAKRQAAERRKADLEMFAGKMAHDVRSPLGSVAFALDMIKRHPGDPKSEEAIDMAGKTLERVGALVDGLMAFAAAGAPPAKGQRAGSKKVVTDVVEAARPAAQARGISLEVQALPDTVVACSPGVLTSMVSSLVNNAIKHMGDSATKRVTVRAIQRRSRTRIEVQDTGPGVPRELRAAIFDPYVRGPGSKHSGLGLGLATVRRLAEAHGGSAGIAKSEGPGSLFWFELPNVSKRRAAAGAADLVRRPPITAAHG
jgi:signal transduction histidine kinase